MNGKKKEKETVVIIIIVHVSKRIFTFTLKLLLMCATYQVSQNLNWLEQLTQCPLLLRNPHWTDRYYPTICVGWSHPSNIKLILCFIYRIRLRVGYNNNRHYNRHMRKMFNTYKRHFIERASLENFKIVLTRVLLPFSIIIRCR